jgi:uncharacterized cupin superfamily protein
MRRFNFLDPDVDPREDEPPGYRAGAVRIAPVVGGRMLGGTLYRLPPGQAVCPYHYEVGEEEWLFVLSGNPLVRTPEGESALDPGDVVCFPPGPDGAHKVSAGDAEARVIIISNPHSPAIAVYPDSDKIGVFDDHSELRHFLPRETAVDYYDGEL